MRTYSLALTLLLISVFSVLKAQTVYYPINPEFYQLVDRYEILDGKNSTQIYTSIKAYERSAVMAFADSLKADSAQWSSSDKFNFSYLRDDNWEYGDSATGRSRKPFLKAFYQKKSDFYSVNVKDFVLHVNPVIYFSGGKEWSGSTNYNYINTRGIEVRGMIAKKIGFYTFMADNQAIFPQYTRNFIAAADAVPNEGYYKTNGAYVSDFLTARGYITFQVTPYINFQFGHDKNFIGHGYRSLVQSDFSANNTFLKTNLRIWKLNYMALFNVMNAQVSFPGDTLYPKKYNAIHHLSINIGKKFNLGIFESIMFGRGDSMQQGTFDIGYLNPVIFYRYMEQQNGSYDNAMLGMDFKWLLLKHFSLYGQFVIDELIIDQVKSGDGWWGNKQGLQLGMKYINVAGIKNLDLQLETNWARPFMYQHKNLYTSFTHYNQAVAHPLGANFKEFIAIVRYQPIARLHLTLKTIAYQYGADSSSVLTQNGVGQNNGGNPLKSYMPVAQANPFNQFIGQGVKTNVLYISFTASYMVKHNLFVDFTQILRKSDSAIDSRDLNTNFTSIALRWNIGQRLQEF